MIVVARAQKWRRPVRFKTNLPSMWSSTNYVSSGDTLIHNSGSYIMERGPGKEERCVFFSRAAGFIISACYLRTYATILALYSMDRSDPSSRSVRRGPFVAADREQPRGVPFRVGWKSCNFFTDLRTTGVPSRSPDGDRCYGSTDRWQRFQGPMRTARQTPRCDFHWSS